MQEFVHRRKKHIHRTQSLPTVLVKIVSKNSIHAIA